MIIFVQLAAIRRNYSREDSVIIGGYFCLYMTESITFQSDYLLLQTSLDIYTQDDQKIPTEPKSQIFQETKQVKEVSNHEDKNKKNPSLR